MPQWTIKSVNNEPICTVKSVERHGQLMSGRWLTVDVDSPISLPLSAGCYIDFGDVRYSIRSKADVEKSARPQSHGGAFTYKDLRLDDVSWQELEDTQMCDYVYGDNRLHYSGLGTFSFYVTKASDLGYRVLANLRNKYGNTWDVKIDGSSIAPADYIDYNTFDEAKSISISSGTNVKECLDLLWSNWGVYYTVENHVVDIITSSNGVSIPLRYGKNNGLKSIRRKINPNVEICTRVRAYGSERNMPYRWYNNKYNSVFGDAMYVPQLMLPHYAYVQDGEFIDANGDLYTSGGTVDLWSNPSDIVLPSKNEILQKYGKRDKEVHWNSDEMGEIFPSMKGMTKSEVGVNNSRVWDEEDCRLDKLLTTAVNEDTSQITGTGDTSELTTGKINFKVQVPNPGFDPMAQKGQEDVVLLMQSGMCQSRGFVILKSEAVIENEQVVAYDLTCVKSVDDEIDQVFPNGNYTIKGGEEYVYTGLSFSGNDLANSWLAVYIGAAEKRLLRAAALWLREHQTEQYVYEITPDNVYLQRKKDEAEESNEVFDITEGDSISLSQDDFGNSDEVVETVTVVYGKEAIPTYEITFLKRDESESLGDRVKGLVGQTISVDSDIAKMNDSLYKKVNKSGFHTLFDPLDAQYNVLDINGDLSNLKYIRANFDFYSVKGVSALGTGGPGGGGGGGASTLDELDDVTILSPQNGQYLSYNSSTGMWENVTGGGGGGVTLREPLASINNASLGTPTESGQVLTWNGSRWIYDIPQGGGGGGTGTVTSITAGTGLSGGTITTAGTISIASTYLTQIGEGHTAYGWGNHANAGYLTSSDIADMATKTWVNGRGFVTANNYLTAVTGSANGTMTFAREGLSSITFYSRHTHSNYVSSIYYNNSATLTSPYYVVTSGSVSGNTLTLGRRKLSDLLNAAGYTWWGQSMDADGVVEGDMTGVGSIAMSGTLRLGSASGASPYIYWGDGTYVYIGEDSDDHLTIRGANGVNILTGSNYELEWNGNTLATQDWVEGQGYVTSSGVTSVATGTGLTGGTITTSGTISINSTYQTYIAHGESAYNQLYGAKWWGQSMNANGVVSGNIAMNIGERINFDNKDTLEVDAYSVAIGYGWRSTKPMGLYGTAINFYPNGSRVASVESGGVIVGTSNTDTTHYLQIGGGRIYWDNTNNALYVKKADGSACHFYSLGGISALGVGGGSTSIDSLRVTRLYFDASRFLEVSGSTLRYYNGSSYKTIAT